MGVAVAVVGMATWSSWCCDKVGCRLALGEAGSATRVGSRCSTRRPGEESGSGRGGFALEIGSGDGRVGDNVVNIISFQW